MTKEEEELIDLLMEVGDIELSKSLKRKISEYRDLSFTRSVFRVMDHKTISFIRNSVSDAEVRRYVTNAYKKSR